MDSYSVYGRRGDQLSEDVPASSEDDAVAQYNGARYPGTEAAAYAERNEW